MAKPANEMPNAEYADLVWSRLKETPFQAQVVELAAKRGWAPIYHTHNSMHSPAGFPDLVMTRAERVLFAELKTMKGVVSPAQRKWLDALSLTSAEVYTWRPSDWTEIEAVLA